MLKIALYFVMLEVIFMLDKSKKLKVALLINSGMGQINNIY